MPDHRPSEPAPTPPVEAAAEAASIPAPRRDDPVRGILMVVLAVAFFSCSDAMAKYLNQTLPSIEIGWMRYAVFTVIVLPLAMAFGGGPRVIRTQRPVLQILRGLGMLGSALFFIFAVRSLPMAEAAAISYISPTFVTALSIPLLGERVGIRRWIAVLVGLMGVLIVARPGGAAFQPAAIFPVLSAMSWACGIVITRKMSGHEDTATTLVWTSLTGFVVLSVLLPFDMRMPTGFEMLLGLGIGVVSTIGQYMMVVAYRFGSASLLAPFSYVQLIWSASLGYLVFSAIPDAWTFVGTAIIAASGLYTAHRERMRRRA
ncbi:DMT family transporter [Azospirillum thermophilum]|uniref:EamA family transporter n=1 Tax=Azospirillum thermophilum TaxID=2202148 RepID=A0A2S2CUR4_9PROT|nr:DMT family transporter [Azospirillum thermophilum]AWK88110.1 EamA family transporter [Azospirillum thermophilum]